MVTLYELGHKTIPPVHEVSPILLTCVVIACVSRHARLNVADTRTFLSPFNIELPDCRTPSFLGLLFSPNFLALFTVLWRRIEWKPYPVAHCFGALESTPLPPLTGDP